MSNFPLHNISHFTLLKWYSPLRPWVSWEFIWIKCTNQGKWYGVLVFIVFHRWHGPCYCTVHSGDTAKFQVEAPFPTQGHYSCQPTVRSKCRWWKGIIDRHCVLSLCDSTRVLVLISTSNINKKIWGILSIRELSLFTIIDNAIVYFDHFQIMYFMHLSFHFKSLRCF